MNFNTYISHNYSFHYVSLCCLKSHNKTIINITGVYSTMGSVVLCCDGNEGDGSGFRDVSRTVGLISSRKVRQRVT